MKITVNGTVQEVSAQTLDEALAELGYGDARVATALNANFVPAAMRASQSLEAGDQLEILAPKQGG